jgi:hypothetical protein
MNRHPLELFVVGRKAEIAASFTRTQWDEKKSCGAAGPANFANTHRRAISAILPEMASHRVQEARSAPEHSEQAVHDRAV